MDTATDIHK